MSTQRYQLCTEMVLLGAATFAILSALLLPTAWQWIGLADWGPLSLHWPSWCHALWRGLLHDPLPWLDYWHVLGQHGYQVAFVAHTSLPIGLAAGAAIALPRWLLYVRGDREVARHLEGPQMFSGPAAELHASTAARRKRETLAGI